MSRTERERERRRRGGGGGGGGGGQCVKEGLNAKAGNMASET